METSKGITALEKVKKWLDKKDNNEAKLAYLLGYKSSVTITAWLDRGHVPSKQVSKVIKVIKDK